MMDTMDLFWRTFGWFSLVWFTTTGLLLILLQALLPLAWQQIRAQPPHGPAWAHTLWYQRGRIYGTIVLLALVAGIVAALLFLFVK